jgi:L-threonylcarbamoyladenylate synthase
MSETDRAVQVLRAGGLVAFPTETVYGLGADATSAAAVRRIFAAKGRPSTNPLIVHVSDVAIARRHATAWPESAERLARAFWPGPLTLVLPKTPDIVADVTAGLGTVGLRVPNHPLALELLRAFDGPVAAPSANRSNHVSPTTAAHVRDELGDAVDVILDGGPCAVGIESTVLDLSRDGRPAIFRPGGVAREQIEAVVGPVDVVARTISSNEPAASPGQQERHYAPRAPAFRFSPPPPLENAGPNAAILVAGSVYRLRRKTPHMPYLMEMPGTPAEYAHHLYAALRELDALGVDAIYVMMPPDTPEWAAVRDRLIRATRPL